MKRWSATLLVLAVCSAVVHADVTIVQKTTAEGGMASMAAQQGGMPTPTMTTRIKGTKGRMDVDLGNPNFPASVSTISDAQAKQVILLDHNQKTARISSGAPPAAPNAPAPTVSLDASVKPTGQSQTIDGMKCDEYAFTSTMSLSGMSGAQMPPEAAAAMQGVSMVMKGSMWVAKDAPGAAEYRAYQKAMSAADLAGAAMGATGVNLPGMDKMAKAMAAVDGMPVLTEVTLSIEAGDGASDQARQMAQMMGQMGAMKVTTKVLSVKTDSIADDVFKVPEGYQVIK